MEVNESTDDGLQARVTTYQIDDATGRLSVFLVFGEEEQTSARLASPGRVVMSHLRLLPTEILM